MGGLVGGRCVGYVAVVCFGREGLPGSWVFRLAVRARVCAVCCTAWNFLLCIQTCTTTYVRLYPVCTTSHYITPHHNTPRAQVDETDETVLVDAGVWGPCMWGGEGGGHQGVGTAGGMAAGQRAGHGV